VIHSAAVIFPKLLKGTSCAPLNIKASISGYEPIALMLENADTFELDFCANLKDYFKFLEVAQDVIFSSYTHYVI
jgi:hypothetical protein